jgi:hypothetical protein
MNRLMQGIEDSGLMCYDAVSIGKMMRNIQTKQAEEKWSPHQCNVLEGSSITVRLACGSEDAI